MRDKDAINNYNAMQKMLEENHNHVDYTALLDGAAKAEAERANASKEAWARKQAESDKHAEQVQSLLNTLAESVREDKTRQAAARIAEETEQAIKEVEQRVNKELDIRPETETDKALKHLLGKILK